MSGTGDSRDAVATMFKEYPGPDRAGSGTPPREGQRQRIICDLRVIWIIWRREMIRLSRDRLRIAISLISPLMFLFVLGTGLAAAPGEGLRQFRTFLFPGVLLMAAQSPAIAAGVSIVWDRQTGFLRQILLAPVRRGAILLGICLAGGTTGAAYGGLVLLSAGAAHIPYEPRLLLVIVELALIASAFTALGLAIAVYIRRIETFQVLVNLCMMPLLLLSGAMFPTARLPWWLATTVRVNPLTYAVDALRSTLPGSPGTQANWAQRPALAGWSPPIALEVIMIAALIATALAAATHRFSRAD